MTKLKLYRVVFGLEMARMFCIGAPKVTVWTDHESLDMENFHNIDNTRLLRLMERI